jgi:hypothetical protein
VHLINALVAVHSVVSGPVHYVQLLTYSSGICADLTTKRR